MKTIIPKHVFILLLMLILGTQGIHAQDTIVKVNNERIICKVKEITTEEIKYINPEISDDISFSIDKNEISKVVLSNGKVLTFTHLLKGKEHYADQNKNCFKFRLLSPLYGYTDIAYERSIRPGRSIEGSLGLIGVGKQWDNIARGASFRLGLKLIKSPDFYLKGMKYAHILKGGYIRPELAASFYKLDKDDSSKEYYAGTILINVGKQWVFDDLMTIDYFIGLGYGYSSDNTYRIRYGFTTGENSFPLAISSGFRVGILF